MTADKEAIGFSKVRLYYAECNSPSRDIYVCSVFDHINKTSVHTIC